MDNKFGEYLRDKRKGSNYTVRTLANLIGKSGSYVSQLECGIRLAPKGELIQKIADVLSLNDEEREELFDLAADSRNSVPDDLADYINAHPDVKDTIRLSQKCEIPDKEWNDFAKSIKEKFMF